MPTIPPTLWGAAILTVALLNIAEVLPDWTTIAATLALPLFAVRGCVGGRGDVA